MNYIPVDYLWGQVRVTLPQTSLRRPSRCHTNLLSVWRYYTIYKFIILTYLIILGIKHISICKLHMRLPANFIKKRVSISLNDDLTRQSVLVERTVKRTQGRADPSNAVQYHEELNTTAQRSWTGCAPGRAASVDWQTRRWCGGSDVAEISSVKTY